MPDCSLGVTGREEGGEGQMTGNQSVQGKIHLPVPVWDESRPAATMMGFHTLLHFYIYG